LQLGEPLVCSSSSPFVDVADRILIVQRLPVLTITATITYEQLQPILCLSAGHNTIFATCSRNSPLNVWSCLRPFLVSSLNKAVDAILACFLDKAADPTSTIFPEYPLPVANIQVQSLAVSPVDEGIVVLGGTRGFVAGVKIGEGYAFHNMNVLKDSVDAVAFTSLGLSFVTGSKDRKIACWDVNTGASLWLIQTDGPICSLSVVGQTLLASGPRLNLLEFDLTSQTLTTTVALTRNGAMVIAVGPQTANNASPAAGLSSA
jgi:WD40 repeat protein